MENFIYNNPTKIIFGKETIQQIGAEISGYGIKKVLILAGGGSIKQNGVYEQATKSLKSNGIQWVEFWGVQPNPVLTHAEEAKNIIKENNCEAILAIGGGSTIDEAKSISAGYYNDNIWDAFEAKADVKKALPIFTILTISATGSEMNALCVLTKEDEKKKWAIHSPLIFPKTSIIDPSVQFSLPWRQTINGGMDAMSHLLEFIFCGTTQEATLSINEGLMRTVIKAVDGLQTNPSNYIWRANLAWSATVALNGMSSLGFGGGEWASHAIEHGISAIHPEVAHAEGLAVVFPAYIKYVNDFNPPAFKRWAENVWGVSTVDEGIDKMKEKLQSWGAPITLGQLNINESEIPAIVDNVMQRNKIGFKRVLSRGDVEEILKLTL